MQAWALVGVWHDSELAGALPLFPLVALWAHTVRCEYHETSHDRHAMTLSTIPDPIHQAVLPVAVGIVACRGDAWVGLCFCLRHVPCSEEAIRLALHTRLRNAHTVQQGQALEKMAAREGGNRGS